MEARAVPRKLRPCSRNLVDDEDQICSFAHSGLHVLGRGIFFQLLRCWVPRHLPSPALSHSGIRASCAQDSLFITPRGPWVSGAARGPAILDAKGELIWMDNTVFSQSMNLNVQTYKGKEYLTFWSKRVKTRHGKDSVKAKEPKTSYVMVRFPILLPSPSSFATLLTNTSSLSLTLPTKSHIRFFHMAKDSKEIRMNYALLHKVLPLYPSTTNAKPTALLSA